MAINVGRWCVRDPKAILIAGESCYKQTDKGECLNMTCYSHDRLWHDGVLSCLSVYELVEDSHDDRTDGKVEHVRSVRRNRQDYV